MEDGAAVGVAASSQAGDGGGVGGAEAGTDEEGGSHTQPHEDADEGDEGGRDGDEHRGAEDDAAQASPHAVEGDGQRLPVQEDRQEDREDHGAGQVHLLPHREQRDAHAGGDEGDDHLDSHEAAGFPSWDERGGRTAVGPGKGCSHANLGPGLCQVHAARSLQTLPSAPLGILDSLARPLLTSGEVGGVVEKGCGDLVVRRHHLVFEAECEDDRSRSATPRRGRTTALNTHRKPAEALRYQRSVTVGRGSRALACRKVDSVPPS